MFQVKVIKDPFLYKGEKGELGALKIAIFEMV